MDVSKTGTSHSFMAVKFDGGVKVQLKLSTEIISGVSCSITALRYLECLVRNDVRQMRGECFLLARWWPLQKVCHPFVVRHPLKTPLRFPGCVLGTFLATVQVGELRVTFYVSSINDFAAEPRLRIAASGY